jgi:hypothetical protein
LEHLVFIRENLELSIFKENNHYLSNIVGLIAARILFPTVEWAKECTEFAINEFKQQVHKQFYKSGINFEGSLAYHRLSSEMCIVGVALIKKMNGTFDSDVKKRILRIADFTEVYTNISDEIPIIGDNDSGRFLDFPRKSLNNHKYLNVLFRIALDKEIIIEDYSDFLCSIPFSKVNKPLDSKNKCKLSSKSLSEINIRNYNGLIIGCKGQDGFLFNTFHSSDGHTHNDKLSIFPIINRKHIFVDKGSFSYTGFIDKRYDDRKTDSHNGLVVNKWEQNKIWNDDVFFINQDARTNCTYNISGGILKVIAWHDGYRRFRSDLKVFRQIEWDYNNKLVSISDWIESRDEFKKYQFSWNFLLNPFWKITTKKNKIVFYKNKMEIIYLIDKGIKFDIVDNSYCPNYLQELDCKSIKCNGIATPNKKYKFDLYY